MRTLYLTIKKDTFDKIKAGKQRKISLRTKKYWEDRFPCYHSVPVKTYSYIIFSNGINREKQKVELKNITKDGNFFILDFELF
jgi:hypothetical protein